MRSILLLLTTGFVAAQTPDAGKREFVARCAGCHGEDGKGGGHGPAIVNLRRPRAATADQVRDIVQRGIPQSDMPAFQLGDADARAIAEFVLSLRTPAIVSGTTTSEGDPDAGERFFQGKGGCSACHMIRARGGILGPDLSRLGNTRTREQIEQHRAPRLRKSAVGAADVVGRLHTVRSRYDFATVKPSKASRKTRALSTCSYWVLITNCTFCSRAIWKRSRA